MCENVRSKLHRRSLLKMLGAATCATAGHGILTPTKNFLAFGNVGNGKHLVFIHAGGGWSLNIAPGEAGHYRDAMGAAYPTFGQNNQHLIGSNDQHLHPNLVNLHNLYTRGELLVVNKMRDRNYSRSHEDASNRHLWALDRVMSSGGIAEAGLGARIGCLDPGNPLATISFGDDAWGEGNCNPSRQLSALDNLGERPHRWWDQGHRWLTEAREAVMNNRNPPTTRENFVRAGINGVQSTLQAVQAFQNINPGVAFPGTGLGNALEDVARVIIGQANSAFKTAAFFLQTGGYDTHTNENQNLPGRLNEFDGALGAFFTALRNQNLLDRVCVVAFGEFGRTKANGSNGTDHGASQVAFIAGGTVNGGRVAGAPPTAADMARQYVDDYHFDFRSIFGQVIEGHLGVARGLVIPDPIPVGDNFAAIFR